MTATDYEDNSLPAKLCRASTQLDLSTATESLRVLSELLVSGSEEREQFEREWLNRAGVDSEDESHGGMPTYSFFNGVPLLDLHLLAGLIGEAPVRLDEIVHVPGTLTEESLLRQMMVHEVTHVGAPKMILVDDGQIRAFIEGCIKVCPRCNGTQRIPHTLEPCDACIHRRATGFR